MGWNKLIRQEFLYRASRDQHDELAGYMNVQSNKSVTDKLQFSVDPDGGVQQCHIYRQFHLLRIKIELIGQCCDCSRIVRIPQGSRKKSSSTSGPTTKRGRGTIKEKEPFLFMFPIDNYTYFTLTILRSCLIMLSVGKVVIFQQICCIIWQKIWLF